jgi:S-adenosylmethionine hydrolase
MLVTLTTDFGWSDGFVGAMKGVILGINPDATIVDITHDVAPQNVEQGALLFSAAAKYFPAKTVHVVVVDPGVGSARRAIAIQAGKTIFVAPDNGVLTQAIGDCQLTADDSKIRAVHLNKPAYWLPRVSNTFHGRDIFAPAGAHLSGGVPLEELGDPIDDWIRLPRASALRSGNEITGRVVHIDRFGNIITNIGEEMLTGLDYTRVIVGIGATQVRGVRQSYSDVVRGEFIALISSSWQLEVAAREGSAARVLGTHIGDQVLVTLDRD